MQQINVADLNQNLQALLQQVAQGEEIIVLEHDREIAHLVPPKTREAWLAQTKVVRDALAVIGKGFSATVIQDRQGERH